MAVTYAATVRRFVIRSALVLLGLCVLATGWATWRAWQVRGDLGAAQARATKIQVELTHGQVDLALAALPGLGDSVDRAAGRTDGPVWAVAAHLPLAGRHFQAVRRTALAAQLLGDRALPDATSALVLVRKEPPLRGGRVDLALLARLEVHVDAAARAADRARALMAPRGWLLPPLGSRVAGARATVDALDDALRSARTALVLAPSMLGEHERRRYFVAVQNNAESRATGGLIGAYALVIADRGKITLERTGTDQDLRVTKTPVPSDPRAASTWKTLGSTLAWFDANLTPHFPDAARNLVGEWNAQHGAPLDGVIALDPLVMRELLTATGPVSLPQGVAVSAANVERFVGHDEYVQFVDPQLRKRVLSDLAATLFRRVIAARQPFATLQALSRASSSGHLYLWSARPQEEHALGEGLVSGVLPREDVPYLSVLTQNFRGNKLDYYLRRTVAVTRASDGYLRLRVTLRNTVPPGIPRYMRGRLEVPEPHPYGRMLLGFSFYGAMSTEVGGVEVDGRPAPMEFDHDHGHRLGTFDIAIPRGKAVTVTILITEPEGVLLYRQQPLVVPDVLEIEVPHKVRGN